MSQKKKKKPVNKGKKAQFVSRKKKENTVDFLNQIPGYCRENSDLELA